MQEKLIARLNNQKISVRELSEKTGIERKILSSFILGKSDELTVGMILDICKVLDCKAEDIFLYNE